VEVAQLSEGFIDMRNITYKIFVLISLSLILGCVTPALEKNKQAILDENNLDSKYLVSTFCSYYPLPIKSARKDLPYMYSGLCGVDSQSGNFFFKDISIYASEKKDVKIQLNELKTFSQNKYNLGGSVCDAVSFLCIPHEQMVLATKTEKHIIEFIKKDSDNFAKIFRALKLNEVESEKTYLIYQPQVNYDMPVVKHK